MATVTHGAARRPRAYVRVQGPDAVDYLNRMVSNDVPRGGSVDALLLTAKARVIAPVLVWRRGDDDVLLLTEPELGERRARAAARMRFAAKCEIEPEEHVSAIVLGGRGRDPEPRLRRARGRGARRRRRRRRSDEELERLRIEAATPRYGRELDERVLPAEAGLEERAITFTKGCYPGQEPIARQHYRGKVNRRLRVLEVEGDAGGRDAGRATARRRSAASRAPSTGSRSPTCASRCRTTPSSRRGRRARAATLTARAPVAQGIERCPAEAEVASSNLAGRIRDDLPVGGRSIAAQALHCADGQRSQVRILPGALRCRPNARTFPSAVARMRNERAIIGAAYVGLSVLNVLRIRPLSESIA